MKVAHVTSWLSRHGGGIPPVVYALARETDRRNFPCSVFGLKDEWVESDCADFKLPLSAGKISGPKAFGFSTELKIFLRTQVQSQQMVHSHGLWMYPGLAARKVALEKNCRLVISPHGMLEPWALNNSRAKKNLVAWLFENKNLRAADCLHALCVPEAENFRRYGLKNPIAVIPNGVEIDDSPFSGNWLVEKFPEIKDCRRILFLSRLHPKKGLNNLLQAWRQLADQFKDWCLLIAGSGDSAYEQELKTLVKDFSLEKNIFFLGAVYGDQKKEALAASDIFVLPSFSEGFSVAILEASAAGLPVLLTNECNFPELAKAGGGIEIAPEISEIENGLRGLLESSDEQRKSMGQKGRELVKKSYSWPAIAAQMCAVYEWLGSGAAVPDFVKKI